MEVDVGVFSNLRNFTGSQVHGVRRFTGFARGPGAILIVTMRARVWWLLVIGVLTWAPAAAQDAGSLVVIIAGDRSFHQPGCVLVAKAGSNVTVAKRADVVRRGLKPHDCGPDAAGGPVADPNAVKVTTQPGDNKYHRAVCAKLGATRSTLTLEEAGRKLWPCPVCRPPIRQRKPPSSS